MNDIAATTTDRGQQPANRSLLLSEDAEQLAGILEKIAGRLYTSERVREVAEAMGSHDDGGWQRLSEEFGIAGMVIPEVYGGGGADHRSLAVAFEVLGYRLAPTPIFGTSAFTSVLLGSDDEDLRSTVLPRIADGGVLGACAFAETGAVWPLEPTCRAVESDDGWRLSGSKSLVVDGMAAHRFVVSATTSSGPGLFLLDAASPGVSRSRLPSSDLTRDLAALELHEAPARLIRTADSGALLARVRDMAAVALSAEMLGGLRAAADMAAEYAKLRYQFGRPIGSFQAVKHRIADMFVRVELATAVVRSAANAASDDPDRLPVASAIALSLLADYYRESGDDLIHVHGGIGFTWEHEAHLYYRRAISSAGLLGSRDTHLDRLAGLVVSA